MTGLLLLDGEDQVARAQCAITIDLVWNPLTARESRRARQFHVQELIATGIEDRDTALSQRGSSDSP